MSKLRYFFFPFLYVPFLSHGMDNKAPQLFVTFEQRIGANITSISKNTGKIHQHFSNFEHRSAVELMQKINHAESNRIEIKKNCLREIQQSGYLRVATSDLIIGNLLLSAKNSVDQLKDEFQNNYLQDSLDSSQSLQARLSLGALRLHLKTMEEKISESEIFFVGIKEKGSEVKNVFKKNINKMTKNSTAKYFNLARQYYSEIQNDCITILNNIDSSEVALNDIKKVLNRGFQQGLHGKVEWGIPGKNRAKTNDDSGSEHFPRSSKIKFVGSMDSNKITSGKSARPVIKRRASVIEDISALDHSDSNNAPIKSEGTAKKRAKLLRSISETQIPRAKEKSRKLSFGQSIKKKKK